MTRALLPILALPALLATGCGKRPPMGDPALHKALSMKALEQSDTVSECLRKDGIRANLSAIVLATGGQVREAKVSTMSGQENPATDCLKEAIEHWHLASEINGQASLILADDSADQDARTAAAEVDKIVHAHESGIGACHEVAGDRSDMGIPPTGLVLITWVIDRRHAKKVAVASNDTGDVEFASCLVAEVESWSFPADALGDVRYAFEFTGTGLNE